MKKLEPVEGRESPSATPNQDQPTFDAQVGKIGRGGFPHQPNSPSKPIPSTLENYRYLFEQAGVRVRFNVIKKRPEIELPGFVIGPQNRDAVILSRIESLAIRNEMSPAQARSYLLALADERPFDPFADWVESKPWDGTSRIAEVCATIVPQEHYSLPFRDILVRKWLLSIVAATFKGTGFRSRGVLTLQGEQGLGKTSWIARLVSSPSLAEDVIKLGHSWDGGSKDARLTALRHRIVELGELEGSFRRELASLKAFITESTDKIRPPYGRVEAEYPRSTIFAASVNDGEFLLDKTGNSRFWTIPAERIDFNHGIDMQQVFAELKVQFRDGAQWWLNPQEETYLARVNKEHRVQSHIEAAITEALDLDKRTEPGLPWSTAREVLNRLGFAKPTNPQFKEANLALRELLGNPRRRGGYNFWQVPWREREAVSDTYDDEDLY